MKIIFEQGKMGKLIPSQFLINNNITLLSTTIGTKVSKTMFLTLYNNNHTHFSMEAGHKLATINSIEVDCSVFAQPCFHPCYNSWHRPCGLNMCLVKQFHL